MHLLHLETLDHNDKKLKKSRKGTEPPFSLTAIYKIISKDFITDLE